MSNVNANINISINSSQALGQLRALQNQISTFNQSVIAGNVAAAQAQRDMTRNLTAQINATKGFTTSIANVETSVSRLGRAIDKNKLSLHEYFRYGVAASGKMGAGMKEHAAIMELAGERVKRLQTQYIALEKSHNGYTRSLAVRPTNLFNADSAIAIQRQQIFNKLLGDGSTALVNWGKNTQWAGRQLMVGFTVPLTIFGGVAGKIFMDLEKQVVQFKRVYGDLQTPTSERSAMVEEVKQLAKEFTKYGISVSDTVALAAKAAATGAQGADLIAQTTEATRLATLGQIDYQQALDATISLQTAFGISSNNLAEATDFLNAVENQTVTSLDDITQAIPRVAPVIKGLGGDVKDLAIFLTAMREGGVNANEGANALKSGLASLINPTKAAREQLEKVGINIDSILSKNKGDLRGLVMEFGNALGTLGKFERQQTLAKMFGKYQFARLGALFSNISKEGSQAARVIDLTALSAKELGQIAEGELGQLEESVGVKFTAALEKLKLAIAPIGEAFLKIATPIIDFATKIADAFNNLPDAAKTFITWGTAIGGVLVPTVIMLVGLLGNFAGNMLKIGAAIGRLMGKTTGLSQGFEYLSMEELDAMAASASLEGQTNSLTGALNVQRGAVNALAGAYAKYTAAAGAAAANIPQGFRGPVRRMATGGFVAGRGNRDSEPALLTPGEFVVNKKAAAKNAAILTAMNSGTLSGYAKGGLAGTQFAHIGERATMGMADLLKLILSNPGSLLGYGTGAISTLAGAFGNKVQGNMYPSLGFAASGRVNNLLDKGGLTSGELLEDWDSRGIERWSESVSRAGLKMDDVAGELEILDKALREQIASVDRNTEVTDATMKQMYDRAKTALPADSRLRKGFDPLEGTYKEFRANIPQSMLAQYPEVVDSKGKLRGSKIGRYLFRSRGNRANWTRGGSGFSLGQLTSAGATMGNALDAGARSAIGAASPAKDGEKLTSDYADGMVVGAEKSSGKARGAGASLKGDMLAGAQSGAQWKPTSGGWLAGGASPYAPPARDPQSGRVLPNGVIVGRQSRRTFPSGQDVDYRRTQYEVNESTGRRTKEMGEGLDETNRGLKGFGSKLMGGMMAMDGLLFGMSMMDNAVGEFAQKIMPAAFAAQGVAMMLPLLTNPFGIAVAAIAAFGAGFGYLAKQSQDLSVKAQNFADAMIASTDAMNSVAEQYGRETFAARAAAKERKREYGVTKAQNEESNKFIESEVGQSMKAGLAEAMSSMGASAAASQFANNLSSMVMQGAIGPKQAKALALAMGDSLGNKTFGIKAAAELESIIGPNGEDLAKKPLKIALEIDRKNQQFIQSLSQSLDASGAADAVNAYAINMGQDSMWGSFGRGLRGLFDDNYEQATAQLQAAGAVIGNQMSQSYDNLAAAKARYAEISQQAQDIDKKDADAKAEAEAAARRAEKQTNMLTASIQKQKQAYLEMFRGLGTGSEAQSTMLTGMEQNILKKFEEDPVMKAAWDAISGKVGSEVNGEARLQIYTELQSGTLDPITLQNLIGMFDGNTQQAAERYVDFVFAAKGDAQLVTSVIQGILGNNLGNEISQQVMMDVRINMSPQEMQAYNDLLVSTSMIEDEDLKKKLVINTTKKSVKELKQIKEGVDLFLGLPDDVQKSASVIVENENDFQDLGRWYQKFKSEPDIEKTLFAKDKFSSAFEAFGLNYDTFNALPNITKALVMKYVTAYMNFEKQYNDAEKLARDSGILDRAGESGGVPSGPGKSALMDMSRAAQGMRESQQAAEDTLTGTKPKPKGKGKETPVETPSDDGGGGGDGGGEKSWLMQQIENLRALEKLYTTAGKNGSKLVKQKGFFFGIMQKLRTGQRGRFGKKSMPTIPQFILDTLGDGPEGLKNAMALMELSKKALKEFVSLSKRVAVGQFVENKRQEIQAGKQKNWARKILEESGVAFSKEEIDEILQDQEAINALLSSKGKKRMEVLKLIRQGIDSTNEEEFDYQAQMDRAIQMMDDAFDKQQEAIEKKHQKIIDGYEDQIDANDKLIDGHQRLVDSKQEEIDDYERLNDLDQQKIDDYNRQIELEQRKIDNLRREDEIRQRAADALQRELDLLSRAEQSIRDAYQKRIDALDAVARLNERILQSQQDQLNVAKALSEGDVYAAAAAAGEMQRNSVQFAADQNRAGLEQGMENQIAGLTTSGGLTRAQAEAQIQAIQDQSYQTQLAIRDIEDYIYNLKQNQVLPLEDAIYNRGLLVRDLQNQIYTINELQIEPLENQNKEYQRSIDLQQELMEKEIEGLVIGGFTIEQWEQRKQEMQETIDAAEDVKLKLAEIAGQYAEIAKKAQEAANAIAGVPGAANVAAPTGTQSSGSAGSYYSVGANGAPVFNYGRGYAAGGVIGNGARDSVPSMLTPGEFVIRKSMVDKYGLPFFESINQGSYSMPTYSGTKMSPTKMAAAQPTLTTVAPVYNTYSVNVNANTNANADDIANTIINRIRSIDSMSVRRINGY